MSGGRIGDEETPVNCWLPRKEGQLSDDWAWDDSMRMERKNMRRVFMNGNDGVCGLEIRSNANGRIVLD